MTEFNTIVVPLDGSAVASRVLPVVRALAERSGAKIILVTSTLAGGGASPGQLDEAVSKLEGLEVERLTIEDRSAAETATDITLVHDDRLLCMSTHGRGGLRRAVLGSVADEVIRAGAVPLLLVGPSCDPSAFDRPGPIELCVDGSDRSAAVVEAGGQWAKLLDRDVHLVVVANPFDALTAQQSEAMFARLRRPLVAQGLRAEGTCSYSSSIPVGVVVEAQQLKSPLMVVAPAARSTWARLVLGSTTLGILGDAPSPVLVLAETAPSPESAM